MTNIFDWLPSKFLLFLNFPWKEFQFFLGFLQHLKIGFGWWFWSFEIEFGQKIWVFSETFVNFFNILCVLFHLFNHTIYLVNSMFLLKHSSFFIQNWYFFSKIFHQTSKSKMTHLLREIFFIYKFFVKKSLTKSNFFQLFFKNLFNEFKLIKFLNSHNLTKIIKLGQFIMMGGNTFSTKNIDDACAGFLIIEISIKKKIYYIELWRQSLRPENRLSI